MNYDRSQIMRTANRLAASGMPRAAAMKAAWASAKAAPLSTYPTQQEAGLRASLKRYRIVTDRIEIVADRLALKAQEAVRRVIAAIADRPALLPPRATNAISNNGLGSFCQAEPRAINLKRGTDGVYRI